jgi:7,8-dihydro-6-hydroxymethylpterin dimethyltransferase
MAFFMLKDYKYLQFTQSLCTQCFKKVDAKLIEKNGSVYILKYCPQHGYSEEIIEEDASWFLNREDYNKPGNVNHVQTAINKGCPYDCGICPNHEQHTCIGLIEVTQNCNLNCPVCYANSSEGNFISQAEFEKMVDLFIEAEDGKAEILQISGGEPTLHPEIIRFIEIARQKGVKYVMLNTNGLKLAQDIEFVQNLAHFKGGFEIYLQFDGFKESTYQYFRGSNIYDIKLKAIENLTKYEIPVTLVCTVERGVNDDELGNIVNFGLNQKIIRGVNIQPVAYFGRNEAPAIKDRLTVSGVINNIEKQTSGMIKKSDFVPLPCNVDRVAITYLYKGKNNTFIPFTRNLNTKNYVPYIRNTFKFEPEELMSDLTMGLLSKDCCSIPSLVKGASKFLPLNYFVKSEAAKINFVSENTFRISITSFVDALNFDIKALQKECVHIITPDLRRIPFSSYNLFYR